MVTATEVGSSPLQQRSGSDLSVAITAAQGFARASRSEATRRAYRSDWAHFSAWCHDHGLVPLPASPETVATYIADLAQGHKVATVQRRLAAINAAHRLAGAVSPTGDEQVRLVVQGIRRTKGVAPGQVRPIALDELGGIPQIGSAYENSGHFEAFARICRQAERDAAEARAVTNDHQATQAIGFSRGARAIVGALAEGPALFERVALVAPPGGSAAGKYSTWLGSLTSTGRGDLTAEFLVVGNRGDQGHPARVAQVWAEQLGAHLEILPSRAIYTDLKRMMSLLAEFLC